MDNYPISSNSLEKFYYVNGNHFGQQYKDFLSGYTDWEQKQHAEEWILYEDNIGEYLSIDETALSNGELYTILTNKAAKGKKGALVAMIKGTESESIISVLKKIPEEKRKAVKEITLDMAASMNKIAGRCFPEASRVTDRFHVQKLAYDALQEIRIKYRWEAISEENEAVKNARNNNEKHVSFTFINGDTKKQLLARSRYLLFKSQEKWSASQQARAEILFAQYPDIEKGYRLSHDLRLIFSKTKDKCVAYTKLAQWYNKVDESGFKSFNTIADSIHTHYKSILNFFDNRSTNASAESFNAKLKAFRASLRGVKDIAFFLFRIAKIYA